MQKVIARSCEERSKAIARVFLAKFLFSRLTQPPFCLIKQEITHCFLHSVLKNSFHIKPILISMKKRSLLLVLCLFTITVGLSAQGTRLLRQPTISSKNIVFVYADDLWIVDRDGGDAKRLTSHEGTESFPHFSPDGKMIAFSAQYDGNTDVFIVNTEGGEPKRLTFHPDADIVQGWTPDGKQVLFRSGRKGVPTMINHFYTVNIEGGKETELPIPQASFGDLSDDGNYVAYTPITLWDPEWRNYRGGQAQPIWIMNLKDYSLVQTPQATNERHSDPVWYKNEVYFLSERDYANNVWKFNPQTKELKQISVHKRFYRCTHLYFCNQSPCETIFVLFP